MSRSRYMTGGTEAAALTRVELAMIRAVEAFSRWCVFLNQSVSGIQLSHQDVWLLHSIRMRGGAENLSELLMFLNRNDVSGIQYSLKKLEQHGLVNRVAGHSKREAGYTLTETGTEITRQYAELRQELLLPLVAEINGFHPALGTAATSLERLVGLYDQATQAVLNRRILES